MKKLPWRSIPFLWPSDHLQGCERMKDFIPKFIPLSTPSPLHEFQLYTDGSKTYVEVLHFLIHKKTTVTEIELSAIIFTLDKRDLFLCYCPRVSVNTDHNALVRGGGLQQGTVLPPEPKTRPPSGENPTL